MGYVFKIFYKPKEVFEGIKEDKAKWIYPFILVIIGAVIVFLLSRFLTFDLYIEKVKESLSKLPPEQQEQALENVKKFGFISGIISVIVFTPVTLLIISAVVYIFTTFFALNVDFKKIFTLITYAQLISIIGGIITILTISLTDNIYAGFHLGLLSSVKKGKLFYTLRIIDIFTLWKLFIWAEGLSFIANVKKSKSYIIVGILFVLYLVIFGLLLGKGAGFSI